MVINCMNMNRRKKWEHRRVYLRSSAVHWLEPEIEVVDNSNGRPMPLKPAKN